MRVPILKRVCFITFIISFLYAGCVCSEEIPALTSPNAKINYSIGVEIARNYKNLGVDIDLDMVLKGMKDGISGGKLLIQEKELRNILISVQSDLRRKKAITRRNQNNNIDNEDSIPGTVKSNDGVGSTEAGSQRKP
jgi:FKBP-type peptidyl-prolyl cis-trans isomerase FklB